MSSSREGPSMKFFNETGIIPEGPKRTTAVTLQVRIQPLWKWKKRRKPFGKKAFPGSSLRGSMTLEAALVLPLFIFAIVCLILPMKIMNTERKLQAALEAVGEDFSRYAYLQDVMERQDKAAMAGAGDAAKGFCRYLAAGVAAGYGQQNVMEHCDTDSVGNISMTGSQIMEDGEMISLVFNYEIRLPFPVLGLSALKRSLSCHRRAWIGTAGKDWGDGTGGQVQDELVYVGKNSTRYHRERTCHYLYNDLKQVSKTQAEEMRNSGGGRYGPCKACRPETVDSVYIMPSGSSYHSRVDCKAITAYVRTAKLSEVEHMGGCSYCSR